MLTLPPVAVRFFRQLVAMRDEFYNQHIMHQRLIDPILDLVSRTMPRDNLICSAGLEFFDFFTKEDLGELTKHLVEVYREKLHALSYMQTFSDLLAGKYPPNQAAITHVNNPDQPLSTEPEGAVQSTNGTGRGLMEPIAMDPDEEYWNTDDEDELEQAALAASGSAGRSHADSPSLKQLVDYASDEEGEDEDDEEVGPAEPTESAESAELVEANSAGKPEGEAVGGSDKENSPSSVGSSAAVLSSRPPERISEKRRREEDEEDELGKLMLQNKRRNSLSTSTNGGTSLLTRKRSLSAGRDVLYGSGLSHGLGHGASTGPGLGKKISINITSSAMKAATTAEDDDLA